MEIQKASENTADARGKSTKADVKRDPSLLPSAIPTINKNKNIHSNKYKRQIHLHLASCRFCLCTTHLKPSWIARCLLSSSFNHHPRHQLQFFTRIVRNLLHTSKIPLSSSYPYLTTLPLEMTSNGPPNAPRGPRNFNPPSGSLPNGLASSR